MEYTKGEWKSKMDATGERIILVDNDEHLEVICREVRHYNMNLISAAPDMYEALKALVDHFRTNDENYFKSEPCTEAIAGLVKAEGK